MKIHQIISFGLLLTVLLFTLPSVADDPGKKKLIGQIYLGHSQILDAAPARQLSFRANVSQFDYQPGGDAIAFVGTQFSGDNVACFVSLAGTQHGTITKLLSDTENLREEQQKRGASAEDIDKMEAALNNPLLSPDALRHQTVMTLNGWSSDGKYLLIGQEQFAFQPTTAENTPPQEVSAIAYTCADLSASPPTLRQVALPLTLQSEMSWIESQAWWSPKKTTILIEQHLVRAKPNTPRQVVCTIYDPATQHVTSFSPAPNERAYGWLDDTHLLFTKFSDTAKALQYFSRDMATGNEIEIPKPTQYFQKQEEAMTPPKTSPTNPALVLEEQPVKFPDQQQVAMMSSQALWIRRTTGLKPLSALPVSLALDPGPYEAWSPSGRQVAYMMHGDLFVTDLIVRDASAREKLALGLDLNCDEQKQIATQNLKQISLGIIMYTQDYDEIYPPAGDVKDRVMPYIKDEDVFSVGSSKFVYHGTGQSLASIDSPSEFVIGTMDTPCAHIVAYADGHVKAFDKQDNGPSGSALGPCTNFSLPKIKRGKLSASASTAYQRLAKVASAGSPGR